MPVLSLCMPTNGVIEWVFPVLDSIYEQNCDNKEFEIIITDNGQNTEFKKKIKSYREKHANLHYFETNALPFLNEIESYKRANGELIKFVNHRTRLVIGGLNRLIEVARSCRESKPILYFSNGVLKKEKKVFEYNTFNDFVRNLSYWSSWSTGMTFWKEDFDKLSENVSDFNELFPHTNVLFAERNRSKYIIDNSVIFDEIQQGNKPKGNYNLFFAFGVEYPAIILDLYRKGNISATTYKSVTDDNLGFIAQLYIEYFVKKAYCSYDLCGINDMYEIFYSKIQLKKRVLYLLIRKMAGKLLKRRK